MFLQLVQGLYMICFYMIGENAKKIFNLNKKEKDIILKHMWPVTLAIPRYKETFLMTYVDKYFAYSERKIEGDLKK